MTSSKTRNVPRSDQQSTFCTNPACRKKLGYSAKVREPIYSYSGSGNVQSGLGHPLCHDCYVTAADRKREDREQREEFQRRSSRSSTYKITLRNRRKEEEQEG